ncbi:hypothetical protein HS096_06080 [candidate division WWE3 bacterium]|uniref:MalT-like TPR region domain-containing protein n=1 Tax=candidate division WWE3 bacterium TaxID=2053526 RepID=A0A928TVW2_UNCKA|nr:hypothetical protein [candidate division WWE3 bacterium]
MSLFYSSRGTILFQRRVAHGEYANVLHQTGDSLSVLKSFKEAEKYQMMQEPGSSFLYSRLGFHYCDFLLAQNKVQEVIRRGKYALKISLEAQKNDKPYTGVSAMGLLDVALDRLTLGRAYLQQGNFSEASQWLNQAVNDLYKEGSQDDLPRGLLARAALLRDIRNPNRDFARARQDLQEVYDIAEPSGMRLHLTDYHLEMARLLLAEREDSVGSFSGNGMHTIQEHAAQAAKLIEETGYKRRLPELQELQHKISAIAANDTGLNTQC